MEGGDEGAGEGGARGAVIPDRGMDGAGGRAGEIGVVGTGAEEERGMAETMDRFGIGVGGSDVSEAKTNCR